MIAKYGALSSSVDPSKLSARVTGTLIAGSGVIVWVISYFTGITDLVTPADLEPIAKQAGDLVGLLATAYGILHSIFGFIRALVAKSAK